VALGKIEGPMEVSEAERFKLLVDAVQGHAIYMLDTDGRVTSWNVGAERLKGYRAGEIIGQSFARFFTPEDQQVGLPDRILRACRENGRFEVEGWRVRKDGTRFWANAVISAIKGEDGTLIGFAKITRDVTERVAAQRALLESESRFRILVQGIVDYAIYMLDPSGIVTNWNAGAARLKGYTADEIVGQHFSRFYTKEDRAAGLPTRVLETARREGRFEAEGWRVRKDGTQFWANVVIDPIRDEQGRLTGFAKITRDITDKRNAELALAQAQEQRARTQKMDALGQLTGGVAHDFNNLLMVVSSYIQTLKTIVADNPKGLRAAQAIELAAQRGQALTRQLLSFARRQPLDPISINVAERLDALLPMLKTSVGPAARISVSTAPDVWPIRVDANELDLALLNLTLNARDAMRDEGLIIITAENAHLEGAGTPNGLRGDFVTIAVADSGEGMPPDIVEKVFDPFFTTKQQGNGLGLSQVHGLAHQSDGTVTIDSALGKGTRVTLYFPRAASGAEPETVDRVARSAGGTALLVEDNPEVAGASAALIEQLGYQVHIVASARAALEQIGKNSFDLVVSDIVMAGDMNGLELARAIRERHRDLPIILVTGYSEAAGSAEKDFVLLRKPYQLQEFSRAVAKVIEARRPSNLVRLRDGKRPRG
jgi:PAS domain S-box-containing protein